MKQIVDEIKQALKDYVTNTVIPFKESVKKSLRQVTKASVQRVTQSAQVLKIHLLAAWCALTVLYFKHLHPVLNRVWRTTLYYWWKCWREGRRAFLALIDGILILFEYVGRILNFLVRKFYTYVFQYLLEGLKLIYPLIGRTLKFLWKGLSAFFQTVSAFLKYCYSFIEKYVAFVARAFTWFFDALTAFYAYLIDGVAHIFKKIFNGFEFLWVILKKVPSFALDTVYVTVGLPIYLYKKLGNKKS